MHELLLVILAEACKSKAYIEYGYLQNSRFSGSSMPLQNPAERSPPGEMTSDLWKRISQKRAVVEPRLEARYRRRQTHSSQQLHLQPQRPRKHLYFLGYRPFA